MKTNSNFVKKKINHFGYILPDSFFAEQLSMPASGYTNKCDTRHHSFVKRKKKQEKKDE